MSFQCDTTYIGALMHHVMQYFYRLCKINGYIVHLHYLSINRLLLNVLKNVPRIYENVTSETSQYEMAIPQEATATAEYTDLKVIYI